jgi:hypothetical protein
MMSGHGLPRYPQQNSDAQHQGNHQINQGGQRKFY